MTFGMCMDVHWECDINPGRGVVFLSVSQKEIATLLLYQFPRKHNVTLFWLCYSGHGLVSGRLSSLYMKDVTIIASNGVGTKSVTLLCW